VADDDLTDADQLVRDLLARGSESHVDYKTSVPAPSDARERAKLAKHVIGRRVTHEARLEHTYEARLRAGRHLASRIYTFGPWSATRTVASNPPARLPAHRGAVGCEDEPGPPPGAGPEPSRPWTPHPGPVPGCSRQATDPPVVGGREPLAYMACSRACSNA
jgi:hypothetical protein